MLASISGTVLMSLARLTPTTPQRTVPVFAFHGQADDTVPSNGDASKGLPSLPSWIGSWARRDGCATAPQSTRVKSNVVRHVWSATVPNGDTATPYRSPSTPEGASQGP
ncbi:hypothetical protein [Streptomyces xylophagus]|uniref:hypothetical protein n=1 Tax=Streptomyces xylophagus TaxID=285514 RepID=UPI0005BB4A3F|nr:hypothetical protein [Streptomyces xylophagus]